MERREFGSKEFSLKKNTLNKRVQSKYYLYLIRLLCIYKLLKMYQFIPYIYKRLDKNPQIIYADYLTVLTFFLYKFVIYTCFNVLPLIQP